LSFYEQYCTEFSFAPLVSRRGGVAFFKMAADFVARRMIKRSIFRLASTKTEDLRPLLDVAKAVGANAIWLGYGNISYPALKYIRRRSNYKVVVDTDSVWSRFVLRGLPFAQTPAERHEIEEAGRQKEEEERWGTQLADVTTAVSEIDAEYYRGLAIDPRQIHIFSNAVDVEAYRRVPPPAKDLRRPCVYLAGTFFSPTCPMADAARWVVQEVLPLVRRHIPGLHFYIVGMGSDTILSDVRDPGITITGQVASVLPYLCHANAALVPLRFESGTRFKILEAGACGVPVVSTTLGAEGIPVTSGEDILIADQAEAFADSITTLLSYPDLGRSLAGNLKKLVEAQYSISALAEQGRRILEYVGGLGSQERTGMHGG